MADSVSSEGYLGPHAVFTDEELRFIQAATHAFTNEGKLVNNTELAKSVDKKISRVFNSSPLWRQEFK